MLKIIIKLSSFCIVAILTCAFDPVDIVFKNIKLIPEPIEKIDNYVPYLPKDYTDSKSEKLWTQPKFPTIKSDKPAEDVISVKKIINATVRTTPDDLTKGLTPTADGIDYMFNLSNIGINIKSDSGGKGGKKGGKGGGIDVAPSYLEKETSKLPILNDLPGMPYLYNKKTPVVKSIKDIKVPGLDDVLPTKVGAPLTPKDYNVQPHLDFFNDYTTPDDTLDQSIFDVIP